MSFSVSQSSGLVRASLANVEIRASPKLSRVPSSIAADLPPGRDTVLAVPSSNSSAPAIQLFDGITEGALPNQPTSTMLRKEQTYFLATCILLFLAGWNDATPGPLIPRMQEYYGIGYATVSLIFVCNCAGFIAAAVTNIWLTDRFGLGITIALGAAIEVVSYCIQATKPPFAIMAVAYAINGFGIALTEAHSNSLVATLPTSPAAKLSIMHALYGVGAFSSPLVATQFAQLDHYWAFHFLVSLGISLIAVVAVIGVFRLKTQEVLLHDLGIQPPDEPTTDRSVIRQIMVVKLVHIAALFLLIYVGMEVSIGGWIVTFLLNKRGAGPSAGYVSSGFFGGIAVGRMGLIWINRKIGEQRVIYIYAVLAIALQLTIWLIPSLYENAIAVSLVGVAIGPFYPIVIRVVSVLLPRRILAPALGWTSCIGQTGSAAFPFIVGVMAQKYGVQTMQPLIVAMMACLIGIWFFVPTIPRRSD